MFTVVQRISYISSCDLIFTVSMAKISITKQLDAYALDLCCDIQLGHGSIGAGQRALAVGLSCFPFYKYIKNTHEI
jgi:hypothetical protein